MQDSFLPSIPPSFFPKSFSPGRDRGRAGKEARYTHRARKGPPMYEVRKMFTFVLSSLLSLLIQHLISFPSLSFGSEGRTSLVGSPVTGFTKCHAMEFSWWHNEKLEQMNISLYS